MSCIAGERPTIGITSTGPASGSSRRRFGSASARPTIADQFAQIEGLGQIFVSAALGGFDRRDEGILRAHDDDRQIRPHPLDARQEVKSVIVRHDDVGDDEIPLARRDPSPKPGDRSGRPYVVAGASKRLV